MTDQASSPIVVKVPVITLIPNPYNPNQQSIDSFDLLVKSIQEDGFTLPVVVNSGKTNPALKNMIIDGEHRWRAATVLQMPEVPVVYKDMDEAQMRVSTIRHNKARGHHDAVLKANVLKELAQEVGVAELSEGLNISSVELDVMLNKAEDFTSMEDVAAVTEEASVGKLVEQGLSAESAQIVAHRHAMIEGNQVLNGQNAAKLAQETGRSVRVELIYSDKDADSMRSIVAGYENPKTAILSIVQWAVENGYGD